VSAVPVVDPDGHVLGMLSEGDLLRRIPGGLARGGWPLISPAGAHSSSASSVPQDLTAREVMTKDVVRATEEMPLSEIARILESRRVKRLPVERDGRLVGIVSRANLAHGLASQAGGNRPVAGDTAIRRAILDTLERASVSTHLLNVVVVDATAWLWGAVESASEETAVLAAARAVPGVKQIANHLFLLSSRLRPQVDRE
jgi:CBS-domain-containing membrane protein